jgi:hypothetical protein
LFICKYISVKNNTFIITNFDKKMRSIKLLALSLTFNLGSETPELSPSLWLGGGTPELSPSLWLGGGTPELLK